LARKGRARELGVGLTARQMIVAQAAVALLVAWMLRGVAPSWAAGEAASAPWAPWAIWVPADVVAHFGLIPWLLLAVLVLVATVNGVNLSDGLDGLAAGLIGLAFAGMGLALSARLDDSIALTSAERFEIFGITNWAWLVAGACLGFLVHNRFPARIFMGNVTSMALGGALATFALATGTWPLLPIVGAVFVIEILSDVIQVGYYKISGGKRVFRMAPIHHHFEMVGWPETRVVRRFWLAGFAAALLGVGLSLLGSG
jgi:phospho-N-acetylmuramoyl-pentapeptide-transferase